MWQLAESRDRDAAGRPKNARPRDSLGRPLPRGAANEMHEDAPAATPEEALERGLAHFNAGRYFQAHEAWEEGWHPSPEPERDFWQGLTQVAVGLTHRQRGNAHGAETLLQRGAAKLRTYGEEYMGIPVQDVARMAEKIADHVTRDGTNAPIEAPHIERSAG